MNANEKIVLDIVEKSGSSFMTGMKILSKEKRNAMFAVYAFCRLIDDIADEPAPLEEKKKALKIWRNDIDTLYRDEVPLSNPVATVLAPIVKKFNLPKDEFLALIDGMEMDIPDGMRAPTMNELELYCRRVAGAVGVLSVFIGNGAKIRRRFRRSPPTDEHFARYGRGYGIGAFVYAARKFGKSGHCHQ